MIAAMILCIAGQLIIIPEVRFGAGRHIDQIDPKDFQQAFKLNYVTQPIYLWGICLVKLSIGAFLLRVAVIPVYRRIILSVMIFMGLYTFACFLVRFSLLSNNRAASSLHVRNRLSCFNAQTSLYNGIPQ